MWMRLLIRKLLNLLLAVRWQCQTRTILLLAASGFRLNARSEWGFDNFIPINFRSRRPSQTSYLYVDKLLLRTVLLCEMCESEILRRQRVSHFRVLLKVGTTYNGNNYSLFRLDDTRYCVLWGNIYLTWTTKNFTRTKKSCSWHHRL